MAIGSIPIVGGVLAGRSTSATGSTAQSSRTLDSADKPVQSATSAAPPARNADAVSAFADVSGRLEAVGTTINALAASLPRPGGNAQTALRGVEKDQIPQAVQKLKSTITGIEMFRKAQSGAGGAATAESARDVGPLVSAAAKGINAVNVKLA